MFDVSIIFSLLLLELLLQTSASSELCGVLYAYEKNQPNVEYDIIFY